MKHFDLVKDHHKGFAEPSAITLKCKAIKKFVPYDGFYPAQRCDQLAQQFYDSYKDSVVCGLIDGNGTFNEPLGTYNDNIDICSGRRGMQNVLTPLFAPGILFNTIKGGVACDWPYLTSSLLLDNDRDANGTGKMILAAGSSSAGNAWFIHAAEASGTFENRIPFEALIEPTKHFGGIPLPAMEPGGYYQTIHSQSYGMVGTPSNNFYSMMMSNFLAEVPEFFLENKNYTYLKSRRQEDPNFGVAKADKSYSMRVKMYKTLDGLKQKVSGSSYKVSFDVPQTIPKQGAVENITMYSRPSAFGPPSAGLAGGSYALAGEGMLEKYYKPEEGSGHGSRYGYNYPFTPPYYHGEAWADIIFVASEAKKYSLSEIISSCSVQYYRFFNPDKHKFRIREDKHKLSSISKWNTSITDDAIHGPQSPDTINGNAMQIDSSINLFSKGVIESTGKLKLAGDDDPDARWVIQSKFETPILNFKNVTVTSPIAGSGSVAKGMWHQYGAIPAVNEGIMLHVVDTPKSFLQGNGFTKFQANQTGSLADLVGFASEPARMGEVANNKKVKEAVVAVPFVEKDGHRQYFKMPRKDLDYAIEAIKDPLNQTKRGKVGNSVFQMIMKMKQYNFPPVMDFINYDEVDPFYMYIFEFSHKFSKADLADMWQNLPPVLNETMETVEATISHPLLANEILGGGVVEKPSPGGGGMITFAAEKGNEVPNNIKWMVFKVKQKAKKKYFDAILQKRESLDVSSAKAMVSEGFGPLGRPLKFGYNWPYDFFSLVELVKIDAEVTFSDIDADSGAIKPKVGKNVPPKVTEKFQELNESVKKGRRK